MMMVINELVEDEVSKVLLSLKGYFTYGSLKYKQTKPKFRKTQDIGSL